MSDEKMVEVYLMQGVEGPSLCIADRRVAGPKAWGGGEVIHSWTVPRSRIVEALEDETAAGLEE